MILKAQVIQPKDWQIFSENAHLNCFGTHKPKEWDRIDFALFVTDENEILKGYVTCREHDAKTLYWQYGGAFLGTRGSSVTFKVYQTLIAHCKQTYERITTVIESKNIVMLKMAFQVGFRIVGFRVHNGEPLCELSLEFKDV